MVNGHASSEDRPTWARRLRAERAARDWSQADAVRALRAHSEQPLPSDEGLVRNWKRWESGATEPDAFYKPLIARTFGTVTASLFGDQRRLRDAPILAATGMDTVELVARLRASDLTTGTLDAVRMTIERLCAEYRDAPPERLRVEGLEWLSRLTGILDQRLTLGQHREVLALAGWVALLTGCVEYDMGERQAAEATRKAALSLGQEAGHAEIVAWAHEMRAWYALTQGDHRGVIAAADLGQHAAPRAGVAVQLAGQKAKAWVRMGDRREVDAALDHGRTLLESLPYPDNLANHFVVDPAKFDFYAMDCYRILGADRLAEAYARQVIADGTAADGSERTPMRNAEARVTLAVVAARDGDVSQAVQLGHDALTAERKSLPSLLMCSRELATVLRDRYSTRPDVAHYLDELRTLARR